MAKLNGVKTIDMVNGEITKVAYDGAEYAKVEATRETAKVGDIFLATSERRDITVGAYYEVIYDKHDRNAYSDVTILDDANDTHDSALQYGNFFRKISAPTLEERVTDLETEVAALKGEKKSPNSEFEEVAKVRILGLSKYGHDFIGRTGVIDRPRKPDGCWSVDIDGNDFICLYTPNDIELIETIEFEGATYRKVDREAREGDVVVLTYDDGELPYWYTVGRKYKVGEGKIIIDNDGDKQHVYSKENGRTRETVDVYEAQYVPQEGDIVVIVKSEHGSRNSVGDIGKVSDVSPINFAVDVPQKPNARNVSGNKHEAYEVRKATPAEVEKYEQAVNGASKPKLKAGDYVKITNGTPSIIEGEIYEVLNDEENELHILDKDGDSRYFPLAKGRAKYEILSAEGAKWAKIGRKPNEFKKGDSVFVTHPDGGKIYGIIHEDSCGHKIKVDFGKQYRICTEDKSDLTLVAPVESTVA